MNRKNTTATHRIVGARNQVGAALAQAKADGRLRRISNAELLPGNVVQLTAQLSQPPTRSLASRVLPWLKALAVLAGVAAAGGAVWLIVLAVMAVIAFVTAVITWISTHLLLIGAIALLLVFSSASAASCTGIHCGGCRR